MLECFNNFDFRNDGYIITIITMIIIIIPFFLLLLLSTLLLLSPSYLYYSTFVVFELLLYYNNFTRNEQVCLMGLRFRRCSFHRRECIMNAENKRKSFDVYLSL